MDRRVGVIKRVTVWWMAGCVLAVGVAWGIDVWLGSVEPPYRKYPSRWTAVPVERVDWWPREGLEGDAFEGARVAVGIGITVGVVDVHAPHAFEEEACVQTGWPLRCVSRRQTYFSAGGYGEGYVDHDASVWARGVTIWPWMSMAGGVGGGRPPPVFIREFRLALHPMWVGVAVDGAVLGAAAGLAVRGVVGWRRWVRVRGNRCTRCCYDRSGLTAGTRCPECGGPAA